MGKRVQPRTVPHMPPPPQLRAASRGLDLDALSTLVPRRLESGPRPSACSVSILAL